MSNSVNPAVDFYFVKAGKWQQELIVLRTLVLDCQLREELKWGVPCYTFQKRNVALLHVFKDYCALLFMKGALLPDAAGLLVQQTANTQAARQLRFTNLREVEALAPTVQAYICEAIAVEQAGLKVSFKNTSEFTAPAEFQRRLDELPALKAAFEALTPGRQRAYLLHFAAPRQVKTREARIEKHTPQILGGKGLHD